MYLDGVLIEAKDLVNGVSIVQAERVEKVEYFHVELDSHDVIVAEGALSESYLDDDNRLMFHNARDYDALYPDDDAGARALLRAAPATKATRSKPHGSASRCAPVFCAPPTANGSAALRGYIDEVERASHRRLGADRRSSRSAGVSRHLRRRQD